MYPLTAGVLLIKKIIADYVPDIPKEVINHCMYVCMYVCWGPINDTLYVCTVYALRNNLMALLYKCMNNV